MAVESHHIPNGMQVILEENHAAPVISFNALVKAGSAFETEKEAGIAHVIEHMLFKGTPSRPVGTIARDVEAAGGDINAYTSFDQTVYYINMASRYADRGLDILADAIQHPLFDAEELVREQEVILEEIRREKDSPSQRVGEHLFQTAYIKHPYGRPIIGYPKTVTSFRKADLLKFYERWYSSHNVAFVIVGDFETKKILKKIESAFKGFKGEKPPPSPADSLLEPTQKRSRLSFDTMNIQNSHFALGYHIPPITDADIPALDVLSHILGGTDSSRLEQAVKEKKGLVHRISAFSYTMRHTGLLLISGTCNDGKAAKAMSAIVDEMERLQNECVSTSELMLSKLNIRANEIYERETVGGQAGKLAYILSTAGTHTFEEHYYHALANVEVEDVLRVAQKYLNPFQCTATFVTPHASIWKRKTSALAAACSSQKRGAKVVRRQTRASEAEIRRLKNGLTLIVQQNRQLPLVSMFSASLGGLRFETKQNNGISTLSTNLVTKGTYSRSAAMIAHDVEKLAGDISGYSGRNSIGVRCDCLSEHLREGFSLFADVLTHPIFSASEVAKEKRLLLQAIRSQEDALSRLAFAHFLKALFPKHPYGMQTIGHHTSVSKITPAQLLKHWRNTVRTRNSVITVVGDVTPSEVEELANELLVDMPKGKSPHPRIVYEQKLTDPKQVTTKKKEKQQAHIVFGFRAPSLTDPDRYAMSVLNNILSGQGGRLFLKLRDEMSLAYAVSSVFQPGIDPGYFAVYIGTDPSKIETAIEGIRAELKKLLSNSVTRDELHRSQQYLVGAYELEQQKNGALAENLAFSHIYGIGIKDIKEYPQRILQVGKDDLMHIAQKYIDLAAPVLSIVRPA